MSELSRRISAVSVLLALLAAPCAADVLEVSDWDDIEPAQMMMEEASSITWTYPIPYELLTHSEYLVLANKENLLAEDYVPDDLVNLTCRKISSTAIQMRETAANALSTMFDAAKEDGITLYAHSGYRSYRTQKTMYYNRLQSNNGKDDGVVQYPGASDHQTGLGIDVINKSGIGKKFTNSFASTSEGQWIAQNCWDYGFILRYQSDKEEITGITYESWHLRYVGVQVAQYMRDQNLCLEEFTEEWKGAVAAYVGTEQ